jgi:hypothetical protein
MNRQHVLIGVLLGGIAVTFSGRPAWSEEHSASKAEAGSSASMITSYGGPISAHLGDFSGKLVCLRCDLKPGPDAMKQCEKEGHHHALSMESDAMIHPLLAGTEAVLREINSGELHGKEVTVHGKYYASTGVILVDRIALAKPHS